MRRRRWALLLDVAPQFGDLRVVDLGGTVESWLRAPVRPAHVVVVNVAGPPAQHPEWIDYIHGDACEPPERLTRHRFDLVFSNSVIEHVGGHERRLQFAAAVAGLAPHHWVQTPYRYFPLEPHWLFPCFQFLPVSLRATIYERWPLAHTAPATRRAAVAAVMSTELLGATEMRFYFPESRVLRERVGPLTKSIIATSLHGQRSDATGADVPAGPRERVAD